jgi:hypothetical protein
MKQYAICAYQPDGPVPPPEVLGPIMEKVGAWRARLESAGAWVFTAGLEPPATATVLRVKDGEVLMTDGPFAEGKEYMGGFSIIEVADLDEALQWGTEFAEITGLPTEVRPVVTAQDDSSAA